MLDFFKHFLNDHELATVTDIEEVLLMAGTIEYQLFNNNTSEFSTLEEIFNSVPKDIDTTDENWLVFVKDVISHLKNTIEYMVLNFRECKDRCKVLEAKLMETRALYLKFVDDKAIMESTLEDIETVVDIWSLEHKYKHELAEFRVYLSKIEIHNYTNAEDHPAVDKVKPKSKTNVIKLKGK